MSELIRLFFATDTFILRVSINLCLYEYIIPRTFGAVFEHPLKIGTIVVGARHGSVDIGIENKNIVPLRVFSAYAYLPFDGLLGLPFAAVPRIDDCCFHWVNFSITFFMKSRGE